MRKTWLNTFIAGAGALSLAGTPVHANPALMASRPTQPAAAPAALTPQPTAPVGVTPTAPAAEPLPSSQFSPFRNPIKYFSASVSEMPLGWKSEKASSKDNLPPVQPRAGSVAPTAQVAQPSPQQSIATAQSFEKQNNIPQARQTYIQALTMWPGNVEVLRAAARMEDRQNDLNTAEQLYRQALAANPQNAGAHNDLGLCLARQGKLTESLQALEQAINLAPEKPLYRNNAATVLVELRQDQRALAHLAAVHGAADANYNFGQLLVQRGRAADATPYFQAAVEQNPGLDSARIALAQLQPSAPQAQPVAPATPATATAAPQYSTPTTPVESVPAGQQFYNPATGQPVGFGANGYPPAYQAPVGTRYQYLPPVATQPSVATQPTTAAPRR